MFGNLIKCEACERELQPEDLLVGTDDEGELVRKCGFCGQEEKVNVQQNKSQGGIKYGKNNC